MGTCAEYDWTAAHEPLREHSSPVAPATLYGVAKDALRRLAWAYAQQVGFELAWGRLFFPYGPGESPGRLVASVADALLAGRLAETSSGLQRRDFLYVDDVAAAITALLGSAVVGPVNIASGEAVLMADVVDRVAALAGHPELVRKGALPDRDGDPRLLVGDVTRLRDEVGFRPTIDLQVGIEATVSSRRDKLSSTN